MGREMCENNNVDDAERVTSRNNNNNNNRMGSESVDGISLGGQAGGERGGRRQDDGGWWKKMLDLEEAKKQVLFALPMILTNVCYFLIPLVTVMFVGHLGEIELAASNLANSWATVSGYAFMVGLSGALETLCGQGFGAEQYAMLGIYLQASCVISILFGVAISIFWAFSKPILILLHQNAEISKYTGVYMEFLIPGLFAYGFLQNILRFLQTQSVVLPLLICGGTCLIIHVGITYVLVYLTPLAFKGGAVAVSISLWISVFMLAGYVIFSKKFKRTWTGFSFDSFHHIYENLKLAVPSAAMVCLEYWAFEVLVIVAGLMPNSKITTSLVAICVNTEAVAFNLTYGLSAAASTRVSNELGAGRIERAKNAMAVSLKLSLVLALIVGLFLGFGHNFWASLFSNSSTIIDKFASMSPFLVISIFFDNFQGVLSGVARGCGWQQLAAYVNLGTFYCIGMPIAIVLAFKARLYAKGLWVGLICGLGCQAVALLLAILRTKWTKRELPGNGNGNNDNHPPAVDRPLSYEQLP